MSVNLSIKPRRKRGRGLLWLVGLLLLIAGLIGWQREWWSPAEPLALLARSGLQQAPLPALELGRLPSTSRPLDRSAPVVLATSKVIDNPDSEALTADLYLGGEVEGIPWPNAGGRTEVQTYIVQDGDTLWSIAAQFELDIDTLRWSNPDLERNPDILPVGAELIILPVQGVYHLVEPGDRVESIAITYGVAKADIADYPPNALYPPYDLAPGQGVIVPFGRKDVILPRPEPAPEFPLAWPVAGYVTGAFTADHQALDIGAPYGSTVYAAGDGTLTFAGWLDEGYGYSVIIDHGDGRETWYNHLKGTLLKAGGFVYRGTPVAEVGSTGHSTGPHVHFEVRLNALQVDPLDYLSESPR